MLQLGCCSLYLPSTRDMLCVAHGLAAATCRRTAGCTDMRVRSSRQHVAFCVLAKPRTRYPCTRVLLMPLVDPSSPPSSSVVMTVWSSALRPADLRETDVCPWTHHCGTHDLACQRSAPSPCTPSAENTSPQIVSDTSLNLPSAACALADDAECCHGRISVSVAARQRSSTATTRFRRSASLLSESGFRHAFDHARF